MSGLFDWAEMVAEVQERDCSAHQEPSTPSAPERRDEETGEPETPGSRLHSAWLSWARAARAREDLNHHLERFSMPGVFGEHGLWACIEISEQLTAMQQDHGPVLGAANCHNCRKRREAAAERKAAEPGPLDLAVIPLQ